MTHQNIKPRLQLPHLTGLRGIAAYSVFFAHAVNSYQPELIPGFHIEHLAYFGISLFFILSGFVITYNYSEYFKLFSFPKATYKFFVARFARLYPLYFVVLLPGLPLLIEQQHAFAFLALTQSWTNIYTLYFPPTWSISAECFFYLIFIPIIFMLNKMNRPIHILYCILVVLLACYAYLYLFYSQQAALLTYANKHFASIPNTNIWDWLQYYSPYTQFCSFIFGCLTAKLYMSIKEIPITAGEQFLGSILLNMTTIIIGCLVVLSAYNKIHLPFYQFLTHQFIYTPFIAILIFTCSRYESMLTRLLSTSCMLLAGEISYCVYLLQWQIFNLFMDPTFGGGSVTIKFIYAFVYITLLAYGSYKLIEIPSRRIIRKIAYLDFHKMSYKDEVAINVTQVH